MAETFDDLGAITERQSRPLLSLASAAADPARLLETELADMRSSVSQGDGQDGRYLSHAASVLESAAAKIDASESWAPTITRAAQLHLASGHPGPATRLIGEVLDRAPGEPARAAAVLVLGRALLTGEDEAEGQRILKAEATRLEAAEPKASALMLSHVCGSVLRAGRCAEALETARRAVELAGDGDDYVRMVVDMTLGASLVANGMKEQGMAVMPSPTTVVDQIDMLSEGTLAAVTAVGAAIWAEDYQAAGQLLDGLERRSRQLSEVSALPAILSARALYGHRLCRWTEAAAAAAEALDLARRSDQPVIARWASAVLITVEAVQGRTAECRQRCLNLLDPSSGSGPMTRTAALAALGLLELGDGHFDAAIHWYQVLAGGSALTARLQPSLNMWESDLVEAYIGAGRREEAATILAQLEERTRQSGNHRGRAATMRCRAMLSADAEESERLFEEVRALYEGPQWRFARARTDLARGVHLVEHGRLDLGAEVIARAREEFDQVGARGWAARAAIQLERLSREVDESPVSGLELTAVEIRIAMAAAMGADIGVIASGLFLDEAVTESHLRTAMQKLGVESEEDLAPLLPSLARVGTGTLTREPRTPSSTLRQDPAGTARRGGVSIRLLGAFGVVAGGEHADLHDGITAQAVKAVALAAKLPAEELIEQLWPESDPSLGRGRLRSLLARLRRSFQPVLVRDGAWIVLAEDVEVDVDVFERHAGETLAFASAGDPRAHDLAQRAVSLYGGELLPADRHLEFTVGPRERLRRRYLALADLAVTGACRRGDLEAAVRLIEDSIATDPYDANLYLRAASILAEAGRQAEARTVIRGAEQAFGELGLPLPEAVEELSSSFR